MSEPNERSLFLQIAQWSLLAIVLLAVVYCGSYFALVTESPESVVISSTQSRVLPTYQPGGDALRPVFQPIHEIDVRLRSDKWIRSRVIFMF